VQPCQTDISAFWAAGGHLLQAEVAAIGEIEALGPSLMSRTMAIVNHSGCLVKLDFLKRNVLVVELHSVRIKKVNSTSKLT
jgi:hypothetical protein